MGVGKFWNSHSHNREGTIPEDNAQRFLRELQVTWPRLFTSFLTLLPPCT